MKLERRDLLFYGFCALGGFMVGLLMNPAAAKPLGDAFAALIEIAGALLLFIMFMLLMFAGREKE